MTAALDLETCPYVGLQPFLEEHCEYFFGREKDQRIIIANVLASPLTVFYGSSGVGKSSVLMAGVVPQLRRDRPRIPSSSSASGSGTTSSNDWPGPALRR